MARVKPLISAIGPPTIPRFVQAMKNAGFEILSNENASVNGLQSPLIENADRFFTSLASARSFWGFRARLPEAMRTHCARKDGSAELVNLHLTTVLKTQNIDGGNSMSILRLRTSDFGETQVSGNKLLSLRRI